MRSWRVARATLLHRAAAGRRSGVAMAGSTVRYTDIGANLTDPMFAGEYRGAPAHPPDLASVLARAWGAGVAKIIVTAGSVAESRAALALARTDDRLFCTAGVHPTRAGTLAAASDLAELRAVIEEGAAAGKCVAVGEAGLDYARTSFCDVPTQRAAFAAQLALAADVGMPLFLHLRSAEGEEAGRGAPSAVDDFCAAVAAAPPLPAGGVVHSFDGSAADLEAVLGLGDQFGVGVNGCSLRTDANLAVAASIPLPRLLLETDAPWCDLRPTHASAVHAPPPPKAVDKKKWSEGAIIKGRNEPARVAAVAAVVASIKGVSVEEVAAAAWDNTERLFFSKGGGGE